MQIFVRAAIGTARESPIRNRHFDPVVTSRRSSRFKGLDLVNPGRGSHSESACHGNQKLCSTRRKKSSP
ncbi:hypothetical protein Taro_002988, partial [Colocasia esculenta]|nr:hypothetical protein [Colocasia esculenta]